MKKTLKNILKVLLFVVTIISIPFVFNLIFKGEGNSKFLFISSSISVESWFDFWATYLSTIISSILAVAAIKISNMIEVSHKYEEANQNISLLRIEKVNVDIGMGKKIKGDYKINVHLPLGAETLSNLKVTESFLLFNNGTKVDLICNDNIIDDNQFVLYPLKKEDDSQEARSVWSWIRWSQYMELDFETVKLNIKYSYILESFSLTKNSYKCSVSTQGTMKASLNDLTKAETLSMKIRILDIAKFKRG